LNRTISILQTQNAQLKHDITQLQRDNTQLLSHNDGLKIEYEKMNHYANEVYENYLTLKQELQRKEEWYAKVFHQQQQINKDITETKEKYKTANEKMYNYLNSLLEEPNSKMRQQISNILQEVDKLVKPVYRGSQEI